MAQKIEKQELTKALEEKIPTTTREHRGKLNAYIKRFGYCLQASKR